MVLFSHLRCTSIFHVEREKYVLLTVGAYDQNVTIIELNPDRNHKTWFQYVGETVGLVLEHKDYLQITWSSYPLQNDVPNLCLIIYLALTIAIVI